MIVITSVAVAKFLTVYLRITELSNVTNISFTFICTSQGISAPLYTMFDERRRLLDKYQTKRVGIGLGDIEREYLRILMVET
jgi:hypothetical protein